MADGFAYSLMLSTPVPTGSTLAMESGLYTVSSTSGGAGTITIIGAIANVAFPVLLPANAFIDYATFRETNGTTVSVGIGTTSGGTDVLSAQSIAANTGVIVQTATFSKTWISATATQQLFITSTSWSTSRINCQINYIIGV